MWRKEPGKTIQRQFLWKGKMGTEDFCFYNKTCRNNLCAHIILPKIKRKEWA